MPRGHCHGMILVNLEAAQIIDLLPDREADRLVEWLQAPPDKQVISHDQAVLARKLPGAAHRARSRWLTTINTSKVISGHIQSRAPRYPACQVYTNRG